MNVTIVGPTSQSHLTVFPSDANPRPNASNLNWVANQPPTPNAVTTPLSADGKVSFYKLSGTVNLIVDIVGYYESSTAGPAGPPGPKGDIGDPGPHPEKVVWVAKSVGDFTTATAALASITDNNASHPYVIKIAPSVYSEPAGILLKDDVDIEGSGQTTTTITAQSTYASTAAARAVAGPLHGEIRNLTIDNTGRSNLPAIGLGLTSITPDGGFKVTNVTVNAYGSTFVNEGTFVEQSAPIINNLTTTAAFGPESYALYNEGASPTMNNITATATGATNNTGVQNSWSSPTMNNATATASGHTTGVLNGSSSPTMSKVTATATGGVNNVGVDSYSASSPTMNNVTATASGGTQNIGVNVEGSTVLIRDSFLSGTSFSLWNDGTTRAFNTVFNGVTTCMSGACIGAMDASLANYAYA